MKLHLHFVIQDRSIVFGDPLRHTGETCVLWHVLGFGNPVESWVKVTLSWVVRRDEQKSFGLFGRI